MNRTAGKVAWGETSTENQPQDDGKKIPFLNMGGFGKSWKLRVVSEEPLRYWCHFTTDKNGKTVKVNCTLDESCPVHIENTKTVCAGNQAQARYYVKVIDREDGELKVLDVGKQIVNAIGDYINNPEYGHCKNYDITIKKGNRGDMPLYTVTPSRSNTPLTDDEVALVTNSETPDHEDYFDLESRIKPLSGDTVRKILGMEVETKPELKEVSSAPVSSQSSDDDFDDIDWGDD